MKIAERLDVNAPEVDFAPDLRDIALPFHDLARERASIDHRDLESNGGATAPQG